jgi:hypothetical protein
MVSKPFATFVRFVALSLKPTPHSYLKATNGSTFVARLAGMRHAINATSNRLIETKTKVVMSVGVTPNNRLVISRVNAETK